MLFRRHDRAYALLIAASVAFFVLGGHFAATALLDAQRSRQLQLVNQLALHTSEAAVTFGAATLEEIAGKRAVSCDANALQVVRLHVYQRGAIKDIRVVNRDGSVLCSAYSETLEFDKEWPTRDQMLPTNDQALRLFRVEQFFGTALGIVKDIDERTSIVAIPDSTAMRSTSCQRICATIAKSSWNSATADRSLRHRILSNRFMLRSLSPSLPSQHVIRYAR